MWDHLTYSAFACLTAVHDPANYESSMRPYRWIEWLSEVEAFATVLSQSLRPFALFEAMARWPRHLIVDRSIRPFSRLLNVLSEF